MVIVRINIDLSGPDLQTNLQIFWERKYRLLYRRERYKMIIFIANEPQTFEVTDNIKANFEGRFLQVTLDGTMVISYPANIGDAFYIQPTGEKEAPIVKRADLPTNRGAKIAWALSFIGEEKCMPTQDAFFKKYQELIDGESIFNVFTQKKHNRFAFLIADTYASKANSSGIIQRNCNSPILAWFADDLTTGELNEILNGYAFKKKLPCPREFFYLF